MSEAIFTRRNLRLAAMAAIGSIGLAACGTSGPPAAGKDALAGSSTTTQPTTTSASAAPSTGVPATAAPVNPAWWLTYHRDLARSGVDAAGTNLSSITSAWTSPQLDGLVYAEPLVFQNIVVVATEHDTIYGLDAATGKVAWSTHLASPVPRSSLPCGNIDPLGITSTPAIDPATGTVFAVAETSVNGKVQHRLAALSATTGTIQFQESADPPGMNTVAQQQRAALAVANGRVYISYGGLDGDCGSYHGWVVAAPTSGPGSLISFRVPTHNQGAIWDPAGPSFDAAGNVFVATGNGDSTTTYDEGNSIIKLSPTLHKLDSFAPSNWAQDNRGDADLGSTGPELLHGGLIFQVGKEATGYLLSQSHLGGIGGQLFQAPVCGVIGGDAYRAPDVYVNCSSGLKDVHIDSTSPASFHVAWSGPPGASGPPVIAGGVIWSAADATLWGLSPSTGAVLDHVHLISSVTRFSTPAVGDGLLLLSIGSRIQAWSGPSG
jgi:outer membrane protein assembly factor BamB